MPLSDYDDFLAFRLIPLFLPRQNLYLVKRQRPCQGYLQSSYGDWQNRKYLYYYCSIIRTRQVDCYRLYARAKLWFCALKVNLKSQLEWRVWDVFTINCPAVFFFCCQEVHRERKEHPFLKYLWLNLIFEPWIYHVLTSLPETCPSLQDHVQWLTSLPPIWSSPRSNRPRSQVYSKAVARVYRPGQGSSGPIHNVSLLPASATYASEMRHSFHLHDLLW